MNRGGQLLLALLLLAICGGLVWRLYGDWQAPEDGGDVAVASPSSSDDAAVPESGAVDLSLALPPPEKFAVIAARPLFSPTRRPPPPPSEVQSEPAPEEAPPEPEVAEAPEPPPEAAPPPTIDFTLVGIVIDGSERYALVERHADAKVVRLTEGGDVNGWFAVLIDPDRAVFRQGAVEEELVLKYDAPVSPDRMPLLPQRVVPAEQAPQGEPGTVSGQPSEPVQTGPENPPAWKSQNE